MTLRGIYPALFTPYDASGAVAEPMLRRMVEVFIKCGVDGLYLCGGTGEGLLLRTEERKRVAEIVVDEAKGRAAVMVHVGAISTDEAVALACHARQVGADAISSIPPFYYGVSVDGMFTHYAKISRTCDLPLILYNIPTAVHVTVTPEMMEKFLAVPTVSGIKFSSYQLFHLWQMLQLESGRLSVFSGNDEVLLAALAMGAHGSIGLTLNLMPRLYCQLYASFQSGDLKTAKGLQDYANEVVGIILRYPVIPAAKEAMRWMGYDCGSCRGPLETLTEDQSMRLRADLEQVQFFQRELGL